MDLIYRVRTQNNTVIEGSIEAPNEDTAVNILHSKGYVVLSLEKVQKDLFSFDLNQIFNRPNSKDLVNFTRQLSTLIDANVPLAESLRTLSKQVEKPSLQKVITNIAELVEGGSNLSGSFAAHPKLFNDFYIKLVKSGETTGKLHEALSYLADYLERTDGINRKIRSALSYPIFVIATMILVAVIMMIYVLPQLLSIFKESGVTDLPFTTRILIWLTNLGPIFIISGLIIFIIALYLLWRYIHTPEGKKNFDVFILKIPRLGRIVQNLLLARMSESLSTMIKAQIPILEGLKITADLVGNVRYRSILMNAEESVRGGGSISQIFSQYPEIPPLLTSMVSIGEKTGKIDYMLEHISKFYKTESETAIQNLTQLIEPILILILGIGVAGLVSSILLPIYSIVNSA